MEFNKFGLYDLIYASAVFLHMPLVICNFEETNAGVS